MVSGDVTDMGVISLCEHKLERYDNSMELKQPCFSKINFARYQKMDFEKWNYIRIFAIK